jgi:hypothetical protein
MVLKMTIYKKKELKVPYTIYLKYSNVEFMRKHWGKTSCNKVDKFLDNQRNEQEEFLPKKDEFVAFWNKLSYDEKRAYEKQAIEDYKQHILKYIEGLSVYEIPNGLLLQHYIKINHSQEK